MLYPTWLSSYTHLIREDVRPVSLLNVIGADRPARFFSTKPVVSPPQPPPQSVGSVGSVSAATTKPSKPITVSDKHSKAGSRAALTEP